MTGGDATAIACLQEPRADVVPAGFCTTHTETDKDRHLTNLPKIFRKFAKSA